MMPVQPFWSRPRSWQRVLGFGLGLGIASAFNLHSTPVAAQINQAIVQEIVNGEDVLIDEDPATVDAIALIQQVVRTQSASAGLLFSNGAAGRLGPASSVIVGQCIEVRQGALLASGPANGCTATFEVGVQGTVYVMEVDAAGETQIKVLEGEVKVTPTESDTTEEVAEEVAEEVVEEATEEDETTEEETDDIEAQEPPEEIVIEAGEKITIARGGIFGDVAELSQGEVEAILNGALFQGFNLPLLGTAALQSSLESLYPDLDIPPLPGFNVTIPGPSGPSLPF